VTLSAALLAEARAELDHFDAARFAKFGNVGATRGLARRTKPTGAVKPRQSRAPRQPSAPLQVGALTLLPDLKPCPGGCGKLVSEKTHACAACRMKSWGPHPCKDCPRVLTTCAVRCGRCTKAYRAAKAARCHCGRPVRCKGLCATHYRRARMMADHTVHATWLAQQKRKRERRRAERAAT
jgi:hypothetical protein